MSNLPMKLFDIDERMSKLLEYSVDIETGEIIDTEEAFEQAYNEIQLDWNKKVDNTISLAKVVDADLKLINDEIERLTTIKKRSETTKKRLLDRVDTSIRQKYTDENGELDFEGLSNCQIKLDRCTISYKKSNQVEVSADAKLPKKYLTIKIIEQPNKVELKKALKTTKIKGVKLIDKLNIQIE